MARIRPSPTSTKGELLHDRPVPARHHHPQGGPARNVHAALLQDVPAAHVVGSVAVQVLGDGRVAPDDHLEGGVIVPGGPVRGDDPRRRLHPLPAGR